MALKWCARLLRVTAFVAAEAAANLHKSNAIEGSAT